MNEALVTISVVIPVYSGAAYLRELTSALGQVRDQWNREQRPFALVEAVFVSDSAIDASPALLQTIASEHDWIRVIELARNFGQHPATIAGVLHCAGDWIFTIDEDMQHDPKHFAALLEEAVQSSRDIVYANPVNAVHGSFVRDAGSKYYKKLVAYLTGNRFVPMFNSYRLMRGSIARAAAAVCGHETYFDIALGWFTNRFASRQLPLHDRRFAETGKSGYSFKGLVSHARRILVSSTSKPLRWGAALGVAAMLLSVALGVKFIHDRVFDPDSITVRGWLSIFLAVLFFGGLSVFLLGVSLEYLTNILLSTQGKPAFFVVRRDSDAKLAEDFRRRASP